MYILLSNLLTLRTKIIEKWQMDIQSPSFIAAHSYFIIHCAYILRTHNDGINSHSDL